MVSAIAIPLPLCFSCFVPLRRSRENLTKPIYLYLSRTCDSLAGTPSVINLALNKNWLYFKSNDIHMQCISYCFLWNTLFNRQLRAEASNFRHADPFANAVLAAATALSTSAYQVSPLEWMMICIKFLFIIYLGTDFRIFKYLISLCHMCNNSLVRWIFCYECFATQCIHKFILDEQL